MTRTLLALLLVGSACAAPPAPRAAPHPRPSAAAPAPPSPGESPPSPGETPLSTTEVVARVIDGDTVMLGDGTHVRVLGINALEESDPSSEVHAWAEAARAALSDAVLGRSVRVTTGPEPLDRYGRTLAYLDCDGHDAGAGLLARGLARTYPAAHPRAAQYLALAREAQHAGRGLWTEPVLRALHAWPEPATCAEAARRLDALVKVRGRIEGRRRGPTVHVLTLRDASGTLDLVIFPSRYDEIPADVVERWSGHDVEVTGTVGVFRGRPQIVLDDPWQVDDAPAP